MLTDAQEATLAAAVREITACMEKMNATTKDGGTSLDRIDAYAAVLKAAQSFATDKAKRRLKSEWSHIL